MQTINTESKVKTESWCPVFSGFYNTMWEFDYESELYNYNDDSDGIEQRENLGYNRDINYDDLEIDYDQYMTDVSRKFVSLFESKIKSILPNIDTVKFQKAVSPKYYNFSNDSINIEIVYTPDDTIGKYISDNWDAFTEYIKKKYTSCDGFISHYSNNPEIWKNETLNFREFENDHYMGSILEFVCQNENFDEFEDFYYPVNESIYSSEYMNLKPCEDAE